MARKTIFLETAFWDKFSECSRTLMPYAEGNDPAVVIEKISRWNNIFKFLCRSSLFVDIPLTELSEKAKNDPMLRHLLKCNGDGKCDLDPTDGLFPCLESKKKFDYPEDYLSIYFTGTEHHKSAREHGVLNVSIDTIWEQESKFRDTGKAIKTNKGFAWYSMDILRECSNGMVIIDNFVLAPDKRTGKCETRYDLREILRLMLPESFSEDYHLSIFYFDDSDDEDVMEARKKQFEEAIMKFVRGKKKNLRLKLELFPTEPNFQTHHKDFHDRTIITNNVWIGSEAGFDLLVQDFSTNTNTRAIKTTKTHGLYLGFGDEAADWLNEAYDHLVEEAKKCLKKYGYQTSNRLLL